MCEELKCKVCGKLASDDCNFHKKHMLCNKHYLQFKRHGEFLDNLPSFKKEFHNVCCICGDTQHNNYGFCNVEGEYYGKEMCGKHLNQIWNKGKITDVTPSLHIPQIKWSENDVQILVNGYATGENLTSLSKKLNRSPSSITAKASELGLPDIYINKHSCKYRADYQDYNWCYERYIVRGMSMEEMAKEAGCKLRTIQKWCSEKHGLNCRTKKDEFELDDLQKQLVMFSLLGDGHIDRRENQPMFIVSHAINQKDYLFWKYEILKNICNKSPSYIKSKLHSFGGDILYKCQEQYRICTCIVNDLIPIRAMSKSEIISRLNEFGLAIHFLDDASRNNTSWEMCYAAFTDEEKELYRRILKERFDIEVHLRKDTRYIGFSKADSQKIDEIILRNIPNDLDIIKYKILKERVA